MKKDTSNNGSTNAIYASTRVSFSGAEDKSRKRRILDNVGRIFQNCARPQVSVREDSIVLTWPCWNVRGYQTITATGDPDSDCGPDDTYNIERYRQARPPSETSQWESVQIGQRKLCEMQKLIRRATHGYDPDGWRAQSFRKESGEWSVTISNSTTGAASEYVVEHLGMVKLRTRTTTRHTWEQSMSYAGNLLTRQIRKHKKEKQLIDAGRNLRTERDQKAKKARQMVDQAKDETAIEAAAQQMLDNGASPNDMRAFRKACQSRGLDFDRTSGKVTPTKEHTQASATR